MSETVEELLEKVRKHNGPLSDKYYMVAMRWADEENAANLLEDTKSEELAERKAKLIRADPNLADNAAEREVKASADWRQRILDTIEARHKATKLKIALKVIDMRHSEQSSLEATKRMEMKQFGG